MLICNEFIVISKLVNTLNFSVLFSNMVNIDRCNPHTLVFFKITFENMNGSWAPKSFRTKVLEKSYSLSMRGWDPECLREEEGVVFREEKQRKSVKHWSTKMVMMGNEKSFALEMDCLAYFFSIYGIVRGHYLQEFGNKPRCLPSFRVIEMSCYRLIGGLWALFRLAIWLAWERMWWNGIFRTVNFLVCNRFLPPVAFPVTHSHEAQNKLYLTLSCALIYNVIVQLKYMSFSFFKKKMHFVW